MKKIVLHFMLLLVALLVHPQQGWSQSYWQQTSPKYEMRAVWLTTIGGIDWPHSYVSTRQREELCTILDKLKQAGINTVFLQTRVRATTIYPSAIEPWDGCITGHPGRAAGYDPLKFAIDECHKRGIQLHAWVVTIPIGKWNKYGCAQLRKKQPKLVTKIGEEGYMNPERPETAAYLRKICGEIVANYDVDGIHLDYIRYPETWKLKVSKEQGRKNITSITKAIYQEVKMRKPWVMVSCSPIGKHDNLSRYSSNGWNARSRVCQDAQQWLKDGIMDALFPMMYFRDNNFFPFAIDWKEHSYGRLVVPGLGIYFLDPREGRWTLDVVERQLHVLRQIGLGHCYFRSKFFTDNTRGIYDLGCQVNSIPALIPPMTWQSSEVPQAPRMLIVEGGNKLTWLAENNRVYNVYASKDYPVDITKATNLVATRLTQGQLMIDENTPLNYAVTAQDRYGLESQPAQLDVPLVLPQHAVAGHVSTRIAKFGDRVVLPPKPSTLDADYLLIQTLEGQTVAVIPYKGKYYNTRKLAEGVYQWRSLGNKGRNHRLGYFSVKRRTIQ